MGALSKEGEAGEKGDQANRGLLGIGEPGFEKMGKEQRNLTLVFRLSSDLGRDNASSASMMEVWRGREVQRRWLWL